MSQLQDYTSVSLALSEVLAELGMNDEIVKKRRTTNLVMETMTNLSFVGKNYRLYMFGSQIEGTTIRGLNSDCDGVVCSYDRNVIQKWRDWKHGVLNLLMVENEATPPGYCMLQLLSMNVPVPETEIADVNYFKDRQGRILLKNTLPGILNRLDGQERHGPAVTDQGENGRMAGDVVPALAGTSQFAIVQHWLSQLHGPWPSEDMKRYIANSPCFVVPVGSRGSVYANLEWRISTSFAERCLMFSLNATQLQVYVLMKMLLKTSINYNVPEESNISSFMCKTVVLHSVQNTAPNAWQSHMLIQCLQFSLSILYVCIVIENCPHFIIRSNNLMAGRFTQQAQYQLQQNLRWLFEDILSRGILSLHINDVVCKLRLKLNPDMFGLVGLADDKECQYVCYILGINFALSTQRSVRGVLRWLEENRYSVPKFQLQKYVKQLQYIYRDGNEIERSACRLLKPYLCTTLGSILASECIQNSSILSPQVFTFFSQGLNSDVASSRLKLASVFFCAGDMDRAEIALRDLKGRYDTNVCTSVCPCQHTAFGLQDVLSRVEALSLACDVSDTAKMTCSCVTFTQIEKICIPQELRYEMYRSTGEDLQHRRLYERWMNWAVVDPFPYLHFLCYKVYGRLQRRADQQRALHNLMVAIQRDPCLGHRETALNLLGQCMEQENWWNVALQCYGLSLNIRPRNNAAKLLSCILLYRYLRCHA